MPLCFACAHREGKSDCDFFLFPQTLDKFKEWADLLRNVVEFEPQFHSKICSCHFLNGLSTNLPTIFYRPNRYVSARDEKRDLPAISDSVSKTSAATSAKRGSGSPRRKVSKIDVSSDTDSADDTTFSTAKIISLDDSKRPYVPGTAPNAHKSRKSEPSETSKLWVSQFARCNVSTSDSARSSRVSGREAQLGKELLEARCRVESLRRELEAMKRRAESAESALALEKARMAKFAGNKLNIKTLFDDFQLYHHYTGLPKYHIFQMLVDWLSNNGCTGAGKTSLEDRLLLTLVKLRLNLDLTDLGARFQVTRTTAGRIYSAMIEALHSILFPLIKFPRTVVVNPETLPDIFKRYSNCKCIVDCVEIKCAAFQSCMDRQTQVPPDKYKASFKALIACTPSGSIVHVTKLFPGNVSDVELFTEGGFLRNFVEGDVIAANRRFEIDDILPPGVIMKTSSFFKDPAEPRSRIPTDVAIARMKCYKVTESFFQAGIKKDVNLIFQLVACLVNLRYVSDDEGVIEVEPELISEECDIAVENLLFC